MSKKQNIELISTQTNKYDKLSLYEILRNYKEINSILQDLENLPNGKVLDLGCRVPYVFYILYHSYNLQYFVGVDIDSREVCFSKEKIELKRTYSSQGNFEKRVELSKITSDFHLYQSHFSHLTDAIKNIDLYEMLFVKNSKYETTVQKFFAEDNSKFDIINLSNLLHLLDTKEAINVLSNAIEKLTNNGLIYLRIQNNLNLDFDIEELKQTVLKIFDTGTMIEKLDNKGMICWIKFINIKL